MAFTFEDAALKKPEDIQTEDEVVFHNVEKILGELRDNYDAQSLDHFDYVSDLSDNQSQPDIVYEEPELSEYKSRLKAELAKLGKEKKGQVFSVLADLREINKSGDSFPRFSAAIERIREILLENSDHTEKKEEMVKNLMENKEQLASEMEAFIDVLITKLPQDSERRSWGNALIEYRNGNTEALFNLFREMKNNEVVDAETKAKALLYAQFLSNEHLEYPVAI